MIDQFVGLLLLGLGLKTPGFTNPNVKGDSTEATQTGKKYDTRPHILPVLDKPGSDRTATRPGDPKDKFRIDTKQLHDDLITNRQDFLETLKANRASAQA